MLTLPVNPEHILGLHDTDLERVLAENPNAPQSYRACITCRGHEWFRWYDENGKVADYACDCRAQFRLHYTLLSAGIPLNYQRLCWRDANAVNPEALEAAQEYLQRAPARVNSGIGLVLYGDRGTGKSMLLYLLAKALIAQRFDVFALTMSEFLDRYAAGWRDPAAQAWFEARVRSAGVLVLDDLAREYSGRSTVAESALDHTLRSRVGAQLPTMITSNKTLPELGQIYSSNALSLLSECSVDYEFRGQDCRRQARVRRQDEVDASITRPVML